MNPRNNADNRSTNFLTSTVLGLAYLPFAYALGARLIEISTPWPAPLADGQLAVLGGIVLAFLAGGQWGHEATRGRTHSWAYLGAAAIAGLGVAAAFFEPATALALLCVGFGAQGAWDVVSAYSGRWPKSMIGERRVFTFLMCLTVLGLLFWATA